MNLSCHQRRCRRQGYTLVELLLTTSLLLIFAGLAVVSMETLNQGSAFGEGTIRFETMVRYAHAEAARAGRRVRIDFIQETNEVASLTSTNQLSQVRLSWEPNPATEPDVFQDLLAPRWGVDQVNEALRVADVRLVDGPRTSRPIRRMRKHPRGPRPPRRRRTREWIPSLDAVVAPPASIIFNPDGSCDAAEITLVGLHPEEDRRVILRVDGITGVVTRKSVPVSGDATNSPAGGTNSPASYPENRPSR